MFRNWTCSFLFSALAISVVAAFAPVAMAADGETAGEVQAAPDYIGQLDFWPRRVNPDTSHLLYIQLPRAEKQPQAFIDCSGQIHSLGPPTWSHEQGLVHAFDLEWTIPRVRASCRLFAEAGGGRRYGGDRNLVVRPKGAPGAIVDVTPSSISENDERIIEISGSGFSKLVNVIWISVNDFVSFEHSTQVEAVTGKEAVVVPFFACRHQAPPGQYLLLVENEDRTAVVHDGYFVVAPAGEAEIESVKVARGDGKVFVNLEGFHLSQIERAVLEMPGGPRPLSLVHHEGSLVPSLTMELPGLPRIDLAKMPEFVVEGNLITVLLKDTSSVSAPR